MTTERGSSLSLTFVRSLAACVMAIACTGCTTGVTPECDDSGSCLIAEPLDGSVVSETAVSDSPGADVLEVGHPDAEADADAARAMTLDAPPE